MADRYRRPDIPPGVICPSCGGYYMSWDEPITNAWSCPCGHEQDLVHWLTPGVSRMLRIEPGAFGGNPTYVEKYDVMSGKTWWKRENRNIGGVLSISARIREVVYSEEQYELIRWSLRKYDRGWSVLEIFTIINRFWQPLLGQTPLVSRTVLMWVGIQRMQAKRGLEWP
jgi:hypothetical protein